MTALPAVLSPWAVELERLPAELARGLYPLIARLAAAFGSLPGHDVHGSSGRTATRG